MFRRGLWAFCAILLLAPGAVSAQGRRMPDGRDMQPLDRLLPQIRNRYPGTFYDADGPYRDERGSPHYRLKWMTPEGRVIWLDTDARTGRVIGVEHGSPGNGYGPPSRGEPPPPNFEGGARPFDGPPGRGYIGGPYPAPWGGRGGRGNFGGHGGWGGHGGGHGHHGGF